MLNKKLCSIALAGSLGIISGMAQASIVNWGEDKDIQIKFEDQSVFFDVDAQGNKTALSIEDIYTSLVNDTGLVGAGDEMEFVFDISSVHDDATNVVIPNDFSSYEATGYAKGLTIANFDIQKSAVTNAISLSVYFTGGNWELWEDNSDNYNLTADYATAVSTATDGTQISGGTFTSISGANPGSPQMDDPFGNTTFLTTLSWDGAGNFLNTSGSTGYWDQDETLWDFAVPDTFGTDKDAYVVSTLEKTAGTPGWATVSSQDPVRLRTIPEPTSLALLGLGLLGFGVRARSKK